MSADSISDTIDAVEREIARFRMEALTNSLWRVAFAELATLLSEQQVREVLERVDKNLRKEFSTAPKFTDSERGAAEEIANDFVVQINETLRLLYKKP